MTYEKLKKLISATIRKLGQDEDSDEKDAVCHLLLYVSDDVNLWNKAAIEMSEQNTIIPSRRNKILCYPAISYGGHAQEGKGMSTNEWNSLALKVMEEQFKRELTQKGP